MPQARCPVCKKQFGYASIQAHRYYPLCSERCRLADLGYWFMGHYRLPADETPAPGTKKPAGSLRTPRKKGGAK